MYTSVRGNERSFAYMWRFVANLLTTGYELVKKPEFDNFHRTTLKTPLMSWQLDLG